MQKQLTAKKRSIVDIRLSSKYACGPVSVVLDNTSCIDKHFSTVVSSYPFKLDPKFVKNRCLEEVLKNSITENYT